ncbi:hypothetical protein LTR05_000010 [Lithohypha guttulata]|uniref:Uncharacterized protein n=1 Tax=Lithohypha guttulata TaxID=1690604 RepID=A0AAN7T4E1_9EURO|nr:hypothetical protein LTR05_000010 [Lithohypha guttulata]
MWIIPRAKSLLKSLSARVKGLDAQGDETVPPSMITPTQEVWGVGLFSLLFFSWGLAYGLLDIMNYHVKVALGISRGSAALLAMSYYFAYLVVPLLVGGPIVKRFGYRAAAFVGLVLLATGDQLMSLGAARLNFGGMCGAHFVVGMGVSTLERCANAYVVNCGPRPRSTLRILVAQSAAALGTVIAPLLANSVIFDPSKSTVQPLPNPEVLGTCLMPPPPAKGEAGDLSSVVSFYRFLGLSVYVFAVLLAVLFYRTKWVVEPEVLRSPQLEHNRLMFWNHPLCSRRQLRLWLGVGANFLNLGCQVVIAQFLMEHLRVDACASDRTAANGMMYAQILFLFGRLVAAAAIEVPSLPGLKDSKLVQNMFRPRIVLNVFLAGAVAFTGAGIGARGILAIACICLVMFFEAPSFPMIFEGATAGMGAWTASGESLMIGSIAGGGLLPFINGVLVDHFGVAKSWSLATAAFGVVFSYALLWNIVPSFKEDIDKAHAEHKSGSTNEGKEIRSGSENS